METYLLMLYVTLEQENAIKELFLMRKWPFNTKDPGNKPDSSCNAPTKESPQKVSTAYSDVGDDDDNDGDDTGFDGADDKSDDGQNASSVISPLHAVPSEKKNVTQSSKHLPENKSRTRLKVDVPFDKKQRTRRSVRLQGGNLDVPCLPGLPPFRQRMVHRSKQMHENVCGVKQEVVTNTNDNFVNDKIKDESKMKLKNTSHDGMEKVIVIQDGAENTIIQTGVGKVAETRNDAEQKSVSDSLPVKVEEKVPIYIPRKKTGKRFRWKTVSRNKVRPKTTPGKEFSREPCRAPEGADLSEGRPPRRKSTKQTYVYDEEDLDDERDLIPCTSNKRKRGPRKTTLKGVVPAEYPTNIPDRYKKSVCSTTRQYPKGKVKQTVNVSIEGGKNEEKNDVFSEAQPQGDPTDDEDPEKKLDAKTLANIKKAASGRRQVNKKCPICHRVITRLKSYQLHMRRHEEKDEIEWAEEQEWVVPKGQPKKPRVWPHKCSICEKTFERPQYLQNHLSNSHVPNVIKATVCSVCFHDCKIPSILEKHMKKHEKIKGFKCQFCDKVWKTRFKRARHEAARHAVITDKDIQRVFKCETCGKILLSKYSLRMHVKIHAGEHPYKNERNEKPMCDLCGKVFSKRDTLKNHMNWHKNIRDYKCNVCGRDFVRQTSWREHMKIHMGYKRFKCQYCDKAFVGGGALVRHVRIHTGEKPYSCEVCGARFNQVGTVKLHMRIHTGIKPYCCDLCDQSFTQPNSLRLHKRKAHRVEVPTKVPRYGSFGRPKSSASVTAIVDKCEKLMQSEHSKREDDVAVQGIISETEDLQPIIEQQSHDSGPVGILDDSIIHPNSMESTMMNQHVDIDPSGWSSSFNTFVQTVSSQNGSTETARPGNSFTDVSLGLGNEVDGLFKEENSHELPSWQN